MREDKSPILTFTGSPSCRQAIGFAFLCAIVFPCVLLAERTTSAQALGVARQWMARDGRPLGATLNKAIRGVKTFKNSDGEALYHVVSLDPEGFVVVSADDQIEPIVAFSSVSRFDPSPENPLGALVDRDMPGRLAAANEEAGSPAQNGVHSGAWQNRGGTNQVGRLDLRRRRLAQFALARGKWRRLQSATAGDEAGETLGALDGSTGGSPSDLRVAPLVRSRWSQSTVSGQPCFNYYTPYEYVCGCVATAMAQLMRHYRHPTVGVGTRQFTVYADGVALNRSLRGGNGAGGPYDWSRMVLDPGSSTSDAERQSIGALCYDAGVAVGMWYSAGGSSASIFDAGTALVGTFGYRGVIKGYNGGRNIGPGLSDMVNPNLDAGFPVLLAIHGPSGGHAILCDGYGWQSTTLYHHLNMGWGGYADAWYNLPDLEAGGYDFDSVTSCLFNLHPSLSGEIISGRVLGADGRPLASATVTARTAGGAFATTTGANGIYSFVVASASTCTLTVAAGSLAYEARTVTVGRSANYAAISGNRGGVDFAPEVRSTGTLVVNVEPAIGPWTLLSHPEGFTGETSGTGDCVATNAPAGSYTLRFEPVAGYTPPSPETRVLSGGGCLLFAGIYNRCPIILSGVSTNLAMSEDGDPRPFALTLCAIDVEGDELAWSVSRVPLHGEAHVGGTGAAARVEYRPEPDFFGMDRFCVAVTDELGGRAETSVEVAVEAQSDPPSIGSLADCDVVEGGLVEFVVHASDPDGTIPRLGLRNVPAGASFEDHGDGTGAFCWRPGFGDAGAHRLEFVASDDACEVTREVTVRVRSVDTDGDGLSDGYELTVSHTSVTEADSDGDGLVDGWEVYVTGTDPSKADSDGDGLSDYAEAVVHGTDPLKADSDGDGLGDAADVAAAMTACEGLRAFDPQDPGSEALRTRRPVFEWQGGEGASWFYLEIRRWQAKGQGKLYRKVWVREWASLGGTNWFDGLDSDLASGRYSWNVRGWKLEGEERVWGPWAGSNGTFEVSIGAPPNACAILTLNGTAESAVSVPWAGALEWAWTAASNATSYGVEVQRAEKGKWKKYGTREATEWSEEAGGAVRWSDGWAIGESGQYRWRVRGKNVDGTGPWPAGWGYFDVQGGVPVAVPPPLSPASGSVQGERSPAFAWAAVANAEKYWVEVEECHKGKWKSVKKTWVAGGQAEGQEVSWTASYKLATSGQYRWRVSGASREGKGPASGWVDFSVQVAAPAPAWVVSPAGGVGFGSTRLVLVWGLAEGARQYEVAVERQKGAKWVSVVKETLNPGEWQEQSGQGVCSVELAKVGAYRWRVRGVNQGVRGAWSEYGDFNSFQ